MPNPQNVAPHKFKKGQSGNPAGRPRKIYTVLKKKGFSKDDLVTAFTELAWYNLDELKAIYEDDSAPAIVKVIASGIREAIKRGDIGYVKELLEYSLGKPKQRLEHTGEDGAPIQFEDTGDVDYSLLSDEVLLAIAKAKKKENEGSPKATNSAAKKSIGNKKK